MIGKPSAKFKYLAGQPTYVKQLYQDLKTPVQGVEGNPICANSQYVVVSTLSSFVILTIQTHFRSHGKEAAAALLSSYTMSKEGCR